jgi:hypothetical protein
MLLSTGVPSTRCSSFCERTLGALWLGGTAEPVDWRALTSGPGPEQSLHRSQTGEAPARDWGV